MPEPFEDEPSPPSIAWQHPPLPEWLARRALRAKERITWVRGPWFQPSWERTLTHPALVLVGVALGAACLALSALSSFEPSPLAILSAVGFFVFFVYVVGFASGYFTRLVVTDLRVLIIQGQEVRRSWDLNQLPPALLRYRVEDGGGSRAVDLDALQAMLGGASDQFAESKTIRAFGKELDRIRRPEHRSG